MDDLIQTIAELITEDADIFSSVEPSNKPLSNMEINKQAADGLPNEQSADEISKEMRERRDEDQVEHEQERRVMQPQFNAIKQSVASMNTNMRQNHLAATTAINGMNDLNQDLSQIQSLLNGIQLTSR